MGDLMGVVGIGIVLITAGMTVAWVGAIMWIIFQAISGKSPVRTKASSTGPAITWRRMSDEEVRRLMPPARRASSGHGRTGQRIVQEQAALDRAQMDSMTLHQVVELDRMEHEDMVHDSDFGSDFDAGSDFGSGNDW